MTNNGTDRIAAPRNWKAVHCYLAGFERWFDIEDGWQDAVRAWVKATKSTGTLKMNLFDTARLVSRREIEVA